MLFSVYKPTLDGFSCLSTDPRMDVFHIPDWIATFANILGNEQRLAPGFQGLRRFCYELSLRPEMSPFFNTSNAVIARHHVEQQMKGFSAVDSCASPANYSSES
ncbi:hypothetical protein FBU59_002290 [Linderina macrospora]|uniref:Uncharacterized protein n=1 Tax=Linderina macrospora TaxID=4868 RepID=A0ACC1JBQ9_9FUNG|nr:hypothetical protein FBU59_002290 [Linderina macrospora]